MPDRFVQIPIRRKCRVTSAFVSISRRNGNPQNAQSKTRHPQADISNHFLYSVEGTYLVVPRGEESTVPPPSILRTPGQASGYRSAHAETRRAALPLPKDLVSKSYLAAERRYLYVVINSSCWRLGKKSSATKKPNLTRHSPALSTSKETESINSNLRVQSARPRGRQSCVIDRGYPEYQSIDCLWNRPRGDDPAAPSGSSFSRHIKRLPTLTSRVRCTIYGATLFVPSTCRACTDLGTFVRQFSSSP